MSNDVVAVVAVEIATYVAVLYAEASYAFIRYASFTLCVRRFLQHLLLGMPKKCDKHFPNTLFTKKL